MKKKQQEKLRVSECVKNCYVLKKNRKLDNNQCIQSLFIYKTALI